VTHPQGTAPLERRTVLIKLISEVCSLGQAFRPRQLGAEAEGKEDKELRRRKAI